MDTHSIARWGWPPHPPTPCHQVLTYTAPPSSHGQPRHPPIGHPNTNPTFSFYNWAPAPPLQETSIPPPASLSSLIDASGTHPFSQCAHGLCPAGCNAVTGTHTPYESCTCLTSSGTDTHTSRQMRLDPTFLPLCAHVHTHTLILFPRRPLSLPGAHPPPAQMVLPALAHRQGLTPWPPPRCHS